MIVNWFSKMRHYIVCRAEKKSINIEKTIKLLIRNVWKLHELSKTIISNRSFQFVSLTWRFLCKILNIQIKLSTAFHSEIDDQSEICNQKIKRYLRAYVNYQQNDWSNWLFMTEYVSNTTNFATIKLSSFFINYEFQSRMSFEPIETKNTAKRKCLKRKTTNIHIDMKRVWLFAQKNFSQSQQNKKKYANKHRKTIANYQSKNKIWLSTKNIKTKKSSKKFDDKKLNFFRMLKSKKNNVKFNLSNFMKIHNNFHIFLIRKDFDDFLIDQQKKSSSSIIVNDENEWKVDDILNFRKFERNKKLQYRAKWMNHSSNKKWYDANNFDNAKKIVAEFHTRYFDKFSWSWRFLMSILNELKL